jgi:hypothetical protein
MNIPEFPPSASVHAAEGGLGTPLPNQQGIGTTAAAAPAQAVSSHIFPSGEDEYNSAGFVIDTKNSTSSSTLGPTTSRDQDRQQQVSNQVKFTAMKRANIT